MKQYSINQSTVVLKVKRAPFVVLGMFWFFTAISFIAPILMVVLNLAAGNGFHIGLFFGLVLFGLIGFYLLRNTLWNAYGQETINFENGTMEYVADYGWFKDKVKSVTYSNDLSFGIRSLGYEDDLKGALVISSSDNSINCATKMNLDEVEELISFLRKEFSS